ncbi:MAG: rod shape-determining protein MreD [Oscillospiraceae bacterium]|nr:rod shape-determining protein MreD [Oscillospiraceae bacterium]
MARQDWIRKWLCYAMALLPVWWLDAYILTRVPVFGVTPLLLPVAVTSVAVLEGVSGGAGFGFGAGLLWATAYAGGDGSRVLILTLVGMFVGALARYALARSLAGCLICSAGALSVLLVLRGATELFFMRATLWQLLRVALPQLLWTLVWTVPVYGVFYRVYARVGGDKLA